MEIRVDEIQEGDVWVGDPAVEITSIVDGPTVMGAKDPLAARVRQADRVPVPMLRLVGRVHEGYTKGALVSYTMRPDQLVEVER